MQTELAEHEQLDGMKKNSLGGGGGGGGGGHVPRVPSTPGIRRCFLILINA